MSAVKSDLAKSGIFYMPENELAFSRAILCYIEYFKHNGLELTISNSYHLSDDNSYIVTFQPFLKDDMQLEKTICIISEQIYILKCKKDMNRLKRCYGLLDFSSANIQYLARRNIYSHLVPPCYVEAVDKENFELTTYDKLDGKDEVDILFIGKMNIRRNQVVFQFKKNGLKVKYGFYKTYQDTLAMVRRSKINILIFQDKESHCIDFYRLSFLMGCNTLILHEPIKHPSKDIENNLFFMSTDDMIEKIKELLEMSQEERAQLIARQQEYFRSNWNMLEIPLPFRLD